MQGSPLHAFLNILNAQPNVAYLSPEVFQDVDSLTWAHELGPRRPGMITFFNKPLQGRMPLDISPIPDRLPIGNLHTLSSTGMPIGYLIELPRITFKVFPMCLVATTLTDLSFLSAPNPKGTFPFDDVVDFWSPEGLKVIKSSDESTMVILRTKSDVSVLIP